MLSLCQLCTLGRTTITDIMIRLLIGRYCWANFNNHQSITVEYSSKIIIQLNYIIRYLTLYNSLHATDKHYEKFSIQTLIIIIYNIINNH